MSVVENSTRWTVDSTLTSASFSVRNLGFRTVTGTVPVTSATVEVDGSNRPLRIEAELDLAGIDTGNARRDRDLRASRLLDTDRYPRLRFHGRDATPSDDGWTVPGVLSVRGRDQDVALELTGDARHATATTSIDRTGFGIRAPRLMIGRRVDVRIEAVLRAC